MQCFLIILTIPSYSYTLCKTGCISGNGGAACFSWETLHSIMTGRTRAQKNRKTALITECVRSKIIYRSTCKTYSWECLYNKGNTAQRASGDFARHLLANFPSYFTKMLVNTSSIHSVFFVSSDEKFDDASVAQSLCGIAQNCPIDLCAIFLCCP